MEPLSPSQSASNRSFALLVLNIRAGEIGSNGPSEEVNLLAFAKQHAGIDTYPTYEFTEISDDKFFSYPFVFMTGHGGIVFSDYEVNRLRTYLEHGGFLYADDDYGMDKAFRREIKKVFPKNSSSNSPSHTACTIVFSISLMVSRKLTSITVNRPRDLEFSIRAGLLCT